MKTLKLWKFLAFISLLLVLCHGDNHKITIKYVKCNASEEFVYKNFSCFAKSWSRNLSTVNVVAILKEPTTSVLVSVLIFIYSFKNWYKVRFHQVEVKLLYKYGTIYREVMHTPTFDACALMDGKYNNKMLDQLVQFMLDSAGPDIIHKCPYTVNYPKKSA